MLANSDILQKIEKLMNDFVSSAEQMKDVQFSDIHCVSKQTSPFLYLL